MKLLQPNKPWIEQADAAIRKVNPTAAEVVEARRAASPCLGVMVCLLRVSRTEPIGGSTARTCGS